MGANFSSEPVVEKHTERDQNDTFTAAVSSCQGWRLSQEDEHSLILDLPGNHKASFFAVFDGHGSGRVSKHASVGLWRHLTENDKYIKGNYKEALEESFLSFDREVNESYNAQLAGTTAICVLVVDNVIYCANVGDSRAVACIDCECLPLSQDHKPENPLELKRILAAGGYVFGNRVNGNLALSRAFGDFHYKSNEQLPADQQIVSPHPDIKRIELTEQLDFVVLACDGIWDVMTSKDVVEFIIARLEQEVEPGLICEQLTSRCIATDYELVIGCDNMTVLLVCHTRGRSWSEYCTDIFDKHSKALGLSRIRTLADKSDIQQSQDAFMEARALAISSSIVAELINSADPAPLPSEEENDAPPVVEIPTEEVPLPVEEEEEEEEGGEEGEEKEEEEEEEEEEKDEDGDVKGEEREEGEEAEVGNEGNSTPGEEGEGPVPEDEEDSALEKEETSPCDESEPQVVEVAQGDQ